MKRFLLAIPALTFLSLMPNPAHAEGAMGLEYQCDYLPQHTLTFNGAPTVEPVLVCAFNPVVLPAPNSSPSNSIAPVRPRSNSSPSNSAVQRLPRPIDSQLDNITNKIVEDLIRDITRDRK